ncbi:hypothetical protein ALISP_0725 [Alicycliphilus sp. B1]|nr:hypothetical protein ALISP_0725 [Alicycliphilus sp. B1]
MPVRATAAPVRKPAAAQAEVWPKGVCPGSGLRRRPPAASPAGPAQWHQVLQGRCRQAALVDRCMMGLHRVEFPREPEGRRRCASAADATGLPKRVPVNGRRAWALGIVASLPSKWRAPVRGLNYPGNPTSAIPPIGWNPAGGTPPRAGPFRLSSMLSRLAWRVWSCAIGSSAWRRFG